MRLVNVAEIILFEVLDRVLEEQDICKCDRCKMDIAALALNKTPPNYVVTTEGEVVRSISPQLKIDLIQNLESSVRMVSSKPHHER